MARRLKCSSMRTLTTDNTYRRLVWSYGIFSGNRRCAAFTSHQLKFPAQLPVVTNQRIL